MIIFVDSGKGLLPFLNEIILQRKNNDYLFYFDNENFPYGNKKIDDLKKIFDNLMTSFKTYNPEEVIIGCNTLSTLIDENKNYGFKVVSILKYNLKFIDNDTYILSTFNTYNYLKNKGYKNIIYSKDLATFIEKGSISQIINYLKKAKLPKKIILSCTHYPLIEDLFKIYTRSEIISTSKLFVSTLKSKDEMKILIKCSDKTLKKIYRNDDIFFMS